MKSAVILPIIIAFSSFCNAQIPQFAVVRPDGTTYICPSFDSAYNKALNGDNIYLPAGSFSLSNPINKTLHIYGAGSDQDSSSATGITILNPIIINAGAANGSIEGVYFSASGSSTVSIHFDMSGSINAISNYTITFCYLYRGIKATASSSNASSALITIRNNYIGASNVGSINGALINSVILNNKILSWTNIGTGNTFLNNLFFNPLLSSYCIYQNNIFPSPPGNASTSCNNSVFNNNMNATPSIISGNSGVANFDEDWASTFVNYANADYHVKTTSLAHNSGTDGTDRSIYGGTPSWKEGLVPSNPHIYFKQVATQTNASGQLNIQFKVRTEN